MTTSLKFVYVAILFLSLLLVVMGGIRRFECRQDSDCPSYFCEKLTVPKCFWSKCYCK
ncbi:putative Late nodulin [Medicago truncatula]|uniref:Nodule Cysteine-Rich (NCR) secreted peptide n=1 Tax=Medicago truncatula TaxID=3880 RepID=A7KHF6_MEDTR|nr:nodule-specific cysteine-rich peptide 326 [Medicago truncatula]AFK42327.1 unknown [Medicago truncatula]AFK45607.1 unknown [Medicago truncatula]KEH23243.1 Nodule Cysteine-Rich (NCR) secreted peptide [Medicago truncatula]RHN46604.1 putative Late nodulin [Medicago truncatula]